MRTVPLIPANAGTQAGEGKINRGKHGKHGKASVFSVFSVANFFLGPGFGSFAPLLRSRRDEWMERGLPCP